MGLNLYVKNLSSDDRRFANYSVFDKLHEYIQYLNRIIKSYKNKSVEFDYSIYDKRSKLIYIDEFDNVKLELFYGEHKTNRVYEYDPKIDKSESIKNKKIIKILDRNPKQNTITLEKLPSTSKLLVPLNMYQLKKQKDTVYKLKDEILSDRISLLKLFYDCRSNDWPDFDMSFVRKWYILNDDTRPGVEEQRKFVKTALSTPDFAFLEGPPVQEKQLYYVNLLYSLSLEVKEYYFVRPHMLQ